jgi:cephalosporin hydroxylase
MKSILKNISRTTPGLHKLARVYSRRAAAMRYYTPKLETIRKWSWLDSEDSNFYYKLTPLNQDQLAQMIASITAVAYERIASYFDELDSDQALRQHIQEGIARANYGRDIHVDFGRRLGWYAFVRAVKPRVVIETGVDHGVGSCLLTKALMLNAAEGCLGHYYGTELNPEAGKLLSGPYREYGEILYGDSLASLQMLDRQIDVFINDSDHSAAYEYAEYKAIEAKLSPGAIVLSDNSHVTDELSRFSRETGRRFIFFAERPLDHWYPGGGIGISFNAIPAK